MTPVLSVEKINPADFEMLGLRCTQHETGLVATFREQAILIVERGVIPAGFLELRLDHVALGVDQVDEEATTALSRGARLSADFTPDGPADIPEFWDSGVRIAFFDAPGNAPLEFCQNLAATTPANGHDHYSIRTSDMEKVAAEMADMGAVPVASFQVGPPEAPVTVSFFRLGDRTFEVFNEPGGRNHSPDLGWIGLVERL